MSDFWSNSALLLGGVGGLEVRTPNRQRIIVKVAGIMNTQFMVGISWNNLFVFDGGKLK